MGSPTDDYLQRERLVHSALQNVNLGGLESKFEQPKLDNDDFDDDFGDDLEDGSTETLLTLPPNRVAFYDGEKIVGELYFTESPMRLVELDQSFKPYASSLRTELGL